MKRRTSLMDSSGNQSNKHTYSQYRHRYHIEEEEGVIGILQLFLYIPLENFNVNTVE